MMTTDPIIIEPSVTMKRPKLWKLVLCCTFIVVSSLVSWVLNVFLVRAYYLRKDYWFSALTFTFWISGILASIVDFLFMDFFGKQEYKTRSLPLSIFFISLLGPGYMNIEARVATYKYKLIRCEGENENYQFYKTKSQKYNDQAPISEIIGICFERGPQMVLQLYVFLSCFLNIDIDCMREILVQCATVKYVKCLFSTVNTVAKHGEKFREKEDQVIVDKCCFCCNVQVVLNFIGYVFLIQSRNISLALLAKVNKYVLSSWVVVHWICFTIWFVVKIRQTDSEYYEFHWTGCKKFLEAVVKCLRLLAPGAVSIFIFPFYLSRQLHIGYGYLLYYVIYFMEGTAMVLYWFFTDEISIDPANNWVKKYFQYLGYDISTLLTWESLIRYFYFFVVGYAFLLIPYCMEKFQKPPKPVTITIVNPGLPNNAVEHADEGNLHSNLPDITITHCNSANDSINVVSDELPV